MVPHHPQSTVGDSDVEGQVGRGVAGEDVALVQRNPVDGDAPLPVAALDSIAGDPDYPLDQVPFVVRGEQPNEDEDALDAVQERVPIRSAFVIAEPTSGIFEDDDLAAVDAAKVAAQLVDKNAVADLERVLHRVRWDVESLNQKCLDQQGKDKRDSDENGKLAHQRGAIASPLCVPPPALPPLGHPCRREGRGGLVEGGGGVAEAEVEEGNRTRRRIAARLRPPLAALGPAPRPRLGRSPWPPSGGRGATGDSRRGQGTPAP